MNVDHGCLLTLVLALLFIVVLGLAPAIVNL